MSAKVPARRFPSFFGVAELTFDLRRRQPLPAAAAEPQTREDGGKVGERAATGTASLPSAFEPQAFLQAAGARAAAAREDSSPSGSAGASMPTQRLHFRLRPLMGAMCRCPLLICSSWHSAATLSGSVLERFGGLKCSQRTLGWREGRSRRLPWVVPALRQSTVLIAGRWSIVPSHTGSASARASETEK